MLALAQYYVNPLRNALSEARGEFAQHVLKLLSDFNQRMGDMVVARGIKEIKGGKLRHEGRKRLISGGGKGQGEEGELYSDKHSEIDVRSTDDDDDDDDDVVAASMKKDDAGADSSAEDAAATEFYQRDIGTQTSPALMSRRSSLQLGQSRNLRNSQSLRESEAETSTSLHKSPAEAAVAYHEQQVSSLSTNISHMIDDGNFDVIHEKEASRQVAALKDYLQGLTQAAHFAVTGDEWSHVFPTAKAVKGSSGGASEREVEAAQELKTEIRRLKGYLLSARNFPAPSGRSALGGKGR